MTRLLKSALACSCAAGLIVALGGCSEEPQKPEPPRPVRTVIAKPSQIDEVVAQTGEIQPHVETDLGFRIDGRVLSRDVDVGKTVAKDEVLATLDPKDVENEVRGAEADLKSAESAESLASSVLERQRTLFQKDIVARAKVEEVEANWRTASERRKVSQTALQSARNKLGYTELRAPNDGVVSAVAVNAGQFVNPGQTAIKLASTRERDAVFNVSERLYVSTPEDVQVEVALVSNPSVKVIGRVRDASPSADPATRTYRVRIALPDAPPEMSLGATVTGRVVLTGKPLFVLPASALTSDGDKPAVFVVDPTKKELARKTVVVARHSASQVLIDSGIAEGDAVVTAGVSKLRPGQKVAFDGGAETVR